ncbi:MAG: hypothetical protein AAGA90_18430 [Actinomycetota bacterium]
MQPVVARELWHRLEVVNAVTYFGEESRAAAADLGLKGFWMGYFAFRAAPMGPVSAGVVEATFFNFHPARVRRAVPDAWRYADPRDVVANRSRAAAASLRRILTDPGADHLATRVLPLADEAVARAGAEGRPLFAANREVNGLVDAVEALWQAATTLREHRGDGHVALLTAAGLDGCEAHVLFATAEGAPAPLYQQSRGWTPEDWDAATARLTERGLIGGRGDITAAGRDLHDELEHETDRLAIAPYAGLSAYRIERLLAEIDPMVETIAGAGEITFPNPMGLPARR